MIIANVTPIFMNATKMKMTSGLLSIISATTSPRFSPLLIAQFATAIALDIIDYYWVQARTLIGELVDLRVRVALRGVVVVDVAHCFAVGSAADVTVSQTKLKIQRRYDCLTGDYCHICFTVACLIAIRSQKYVPLECFSEKICS